MKYSEMKYEDRISFRDDMANWLKHYTNEVVKTVVAKSEDILDNPVALNMLHELRLREAEEAQDFRYDIDWLLTDYEENKDRELRLSPLTHAQSYRDVLYDMYIRR